MRGCRAGVIGLVLVGCSWSPMSAQAIQSASLTFDNDGFNFWIPPQQRSDFFYTHGTHLDFVLAAAPPLAGLFGVEGMPLCADLAPATAPCLATHLRISQQIYTPEDLFRPPPQTIFGDLRNIGERPYAGWLSARLGAERISGSTGRYIGLELGVTGGPSLGGAAHRTIHRLLGKTEPFGWEYQLPFELAAAATIRDRHAWEPFESDEGESAVSMALIPTWWATLGTLRAGGGGGLSARLGWNSPVRRMWSPGAARGQGFWAVAVAAMDAELVAHDLFLDGSIWRETLATAREPVLGRTRLGLELGWGGVGVGFSVTRSSRAFKAQSEGHTFSTIVLRLLK